MATLTSRTPLRPHLAWRVVLIGVLAAAGGDAIGGILAGDAAHRLTSTSPVNGTALTGAVLFTVAVLGQLAAHHAVRTGHHRPLRVCLSALVVWYAGCAAVLLTASLVQGHLVGGPVLAFTVVLAAAGAWTARTTAQQIGR